MTPTPTSARLQRLALLSALLVAGCGGGGGGGGSPAPAPTPAPTPTLAATDLAVLYADGDATSTAIAQAYQKARGIPDAQMIRVTLPTSAGDVISATDFATVKAAIDARLPANVQATLVTWTQPSRVTSGSGASACNMGITSALAFGYDTRWCGGCVQTTASPYYNTDTRQPWTDLKLRPSMMLGATTLADAQTLINRGVAADGSLVSSATPAQAVLVRTSDAARSVRYPDFQVLAASSLSGVSVRYIDNSAGRASDEATGLSGVMFYLTGAYALTQANSNGYLPGAVGDTLTSYSGYLPDGLGQFTVREWLQAGLTGSYGTVEEPCNLTEKFPRATVLAARYRRGETLIEAYWKSVQAPGQGLFVGEPLARPWALR